MSVQKRSNSKNYYAVFTFEGKQYVKSTRTTNKKLAEQFERNFYNKLLEEKLNGGVEITFGDAIDKYLASKRGNRNYKSLVHYSNEWSETISRTSLLSTLTSIDIDKGVTKKRSQGVTPATLKHYVALVRGVINHAQSIGYRVSQINYPKFKISNARIRYLTEDEERRLLKELQPSNVMKLPEKLRTPQMLADKQDQHDITITLLDTGARLNEILSLRWCDVSLQNRTINLWRTKTNNESHLHMTDRLFHILSRRSQDHELVFVGRGGTKRSSVNGIKKAIKRAGIRDFRIHDLRHTHASRLARGGMSIQEIALILGHSNITTTLRYSHLVGDEVTTKAAAIINDYGINYENNN